MSHRRSSPILPRENDELLLLLTMLGTGGVLSVIEARLF